MTKRRLMPAAGLLALGLLAAIFCAGCAHEPMLEYGPENHGLRLGLSIRTTRFGDPEPTTNVYVIRLDLFSSRKQLILLVADWPYEELKGNYAEFVKSAVAFLSFPEVQPSSTRTTGAARKSPQPKCTLKPGEHLLIKWETIDAFKVRDIFDSENKKPLFPSAGLYGVRIRVLLVTDAGERILLTSNEQQVPVGGSVAMPKYATAQVVSAYPEKKIATINLGSDHGIAKGDTFLIKWGLQASWRLTITNVHEQFAEGAVKTLHSEGGMPAFPPEHWMATLEPPDLENIGEKYLR